MKNELEKFIKMIQLFAGNASKYIVSLSFIFFHWVGGFAFTECEKKDLLFSIHTR